MQTVLLALLSVALTVFAKPNAIHGTDAAADDLITNLPGWSSTAFKQYSGYLEVDAAHGRNLFYWFTESSNDPANDPLVLWMNGGPGCSSVGGGLMTELGPWFAGPNGTLVPNPHAWNTAANVIFLESPAGVGFSYSNNASDYVVGDERTAKDVRTAMLQFLARFPQYSKSPFWVSGESYGGHYVPTATAAIVDGNSNAAVTGDPIINIQGFLVGNAWTDAKYDNNGTVLNHWTHGLISTATYNGIQTHCNFSEIGPLAMRDSVPALRRMSLSGGDVCDNFVNTAMEELGDIDIYQIYADVGRDCDASKAVSASGSSIGNGDIYPAGCVADYLPCAETYTQAYLRRADVQQAIHVRDSSVTKLPAWATCSSIVDYSREDLLSSMFPVYNHLRASTNPAGSALKLLVYSGTVDGIVPTTGTMFWLDALNWDVKTPKKTWTYNNQVGGRVTEFDGLTFITIRGAGHMCPSTQPGRSLHMLKSWMSGQPF